MTSLKQRAANRRNAQRSTGPRTDQGRKKIGANALKHGLNSPIESTPWASELDQVEALLQFEGFGSAKARELARGLVEFERNMAYQRERFLGALAGEPRKQLVPESAQQDLEVAAQIALLRGQKQTHLLGMDRPLAKEMQKFLEQSANRQIREANRDVARELKNADRYLRRAANQLIKQLKSLGD